MRMAKVLLKTKIYYGGRIRPEGSIVNYDIDKFGEKLPSWVGKIMHPDTEERKGAPIVVEQKTTTLHELAEGTKINLSKPSGVQEVPQSPEAVETVKITEGTGFEVPAIEVPAEVPQGEVAQNAN